MIRLCLGVFLVAAVSAFSPKMPGLLNGFSSLKLAQNGKAISSASRLPASCLFAEKKKIVVLGGDGFCGWPTSLYLSDKGHGKSRLQRITSSCLYSTTVFNCFQVFRRRRVSGLLRFRRIFPLTMFRPLTSPPNLLLQMSL